MNRRNTLALSTTALMFLGTGLPASNAVAQQKEQLLGTWRFVSAVNTRADGTKFDPWGGKAIGMQMSDSTGHFSWQIIRSDIPKLASNNRLEGTADEFKAVAQGVLSYFGTYSLDDSGKTLTQLIESSSFPNFPSLAVSVESQGPPMVFGEQRSSGLQEPGRLELAPRSSLGTRCRIHRGLAP